MPGWNISLVDSPSLDCKSPGGVLSFNSCEGGTGVVSKLMSPVDGSTLFDCKSLEWDNDVGISTPNRERTPPGLDENPALLLE